MNVLHPGTTHLGAELQQLRHHVGEALVGGDAEHRSVVQVLGAHVRVRSGQKHQPAHLQKCHGNLTLHKKMSNKKFIQQAL